MSFEHLKKSAERSFADATEFQAQKPETAMASKAHGHEALASYYFANDDSRGVEELRHAIEAEVARYLTFGSSVRPFPQYRYLLLALAVGDLDRAREIAAFPIDRKYWSRFDAAVTYRICKILGVPQDVKEYKGSYTTTEQSFLQALDDIGAGLTFDEREVHVFWKTLRKRRYELTVFEHKDLFNPALETLRAV